MKRASSLFRRRMIVSITGAVLMALGGTACSQQAEVHQAEAAKGAATGAEPSQALYQTNCGACHQATGQGLTGAFPPLAGNQRVIDDPDRVIENVLNGLTGELVVDGVTYNGVMPPMQRSLSISSTRMRPGRTRSGQ